MIKRSDRETSPTADSAVPVSRGRIARFISSLRVVDVAPALALAIYGAVWIALHASQSRGLTHTVFQCLALAENVIAVLLARRKPLVSLLGVLLVYLLVDLEPTTLPPSLFALTIVATLGSRRSIVIGSAAAATVMVAMPLIHGEALSLFSASWHLAVGFLAVCIGLYFRSREPWASTVQRETKPALASAAKDEVD